MKTRLIYFIFCLSFILQAQDVFIANKTYPVVFEDTTLNANMKTNIVEDLTLYFTYSEDFSDAFKFDYVRNDGAVMFYHCNSISKDLFENLKCQHLGGTTNLFVNTAVTEFYKSQYAMLENCGITNAFERATEFVNSLHTGCITNQPIQKKIEFMVANPHNTAPNYTISEKLEALHGWLNADYYPVSIACFLKGKVWSNDNEDRYVFLIRRKHRNNSKYNSYSDLAIVYYNNRWSLIAIELTK